MQLVEHPPSVAIVAVDDDDLVLVRQARPGAREQTIELPSGKVEPGETPREAAERELAEECGLAASSYRELGSFWAVPAYSTEYVHVFEATGLWAVPTAGTDPDEDIEVQRVAAEQAIEAVEDAVSVAALALWQRRP
jgi:ADP-ribose pyrophosphatase